MIDHSDPNARIDRDQREISAVMLSLEETLDPPTGYFPVGLGWKYRNALDPFRLAGDMVGVTATGSEIVFYEKAVAKSADFNGYFFDQTGSPFLDLQSDSPLLLTVCDTNEPLNLAAMGQPPFGEPSFVHSAKHLQFAGVISISFVAHHLPEWAGDATALGFRPEGVTIGWSALRRVVSLVQRHEHLTRERTAALQQAAVPTEQKSRETDEEAFELIAKAEAEEERRTEEELDDSRIAYMLVRDDDA